MVPFVAALGRALRECQLRATRPRILTAMMTGTQVQFKTDIKLMTDIALSSMPFNLFWLQVLTLSKLFGSAGKTPQTPMRLRTSSIECLLWSILKRGRRWPMN